METSGERTAFALRQFAERTERRGDVGLAAAFTGIAKLLDAAPVAASIEEQRAILRLIEIAVISDIPFNIE